MGLEKKYSRDSPLIIHSEYNDQQYIIINEGYDIFGEIEIEIGYHDETKDSTIFLKMNQLQKIIKHLNIIEAKRRGLE